MKNAKKDNMIIKRRLKAARPPKLCEIRLTRSSPSFKKVDPCEEAPGGAEKAGREMTD
jgi:hypothetical protein